LVGRARHLRQLESPLECGQSLGDDLELLIRQWLQQMTHGLLGQRRPLSDTVRPLWGDAQPNQTAIAGVAVFANDLLGGEAADEDRYPTLGKPRHPRDLVDSCARVVGDLLEYGQARTGHRERQPMIPGQLHVLPTELSLHAAQQQEDAFLSLRTARLSVYFNGAARYKRNVHA
jgi:hypothetical protein